MKSQLRLFPFAVALVIIGLFTSACAPFNLQGFHLPKIQIEQGEPQPQTPVVVPTATLAPSPNPSTLANPSSATLLTTLEDTLAQVYAQVNPSVVNIQTTQRLAPSLNLPFNFPGQAPDQAPVTRSLGSGFVWDTQGHVVTNNHVIDGADRITVTFADGNTVEAKVVGADSDADLAVLKVDVTAEKLVPVRLADSKQVKVGQLAIAIGNPYGLEGTMTVGFVSALGRSLPVQSTTSGGATYTIPDVIQTDAPINPGNSGGVLVNIHGEVIGVTAAIESPVRANAGIGFVIPSNIVRRVVPALIANGHYDHPYLGISGTTLTSDLAKAMGLSSDQRGALVIDVTPNSPADKAGLRGSDRQITLEGNPARVGGDVITAIDGNPVQKFEDLASYLATATSVGQKVTLTILRNGHEQTIEVTLGARPRTQSSASSTTRSGAYLGITGRTLTPEIAQAMGLDPNQQGVLVVNVVSGSPADKAGLRGSFKPATINSEQMLIGGDIITAFDDQPITSFEDLQTALAQAAPGQKVTLTLLREGKPQQVEVTLGTRPNS
ncbi:PDZ domain-containing protein [uncultured Thermanaerothrix sp.]|uniref:PDZ domain-containing protein n=1 Tax=uncultured Thermanaerothrix sp. TaxID=1195149 RepID=UPI00260ABAA0|nr:PDZ domain-containing protein [uncultured Thermanaerothrix sp.]